MKILITADLHYDIRRSRAPAEELARSVCHEGADALVLLGDTAGADADCFRQALALFQGFAGRKLLVPGNHCLWCRPDDDSLDRYERLLPAWAAEEGFAVLDHAPVVQEGVGLVGSIGWYDYSLRDASLGVPLEFYRQKISPGAAAYYGHDDLVSAHGGGLERAHWRLGARWMDSEHVRLPMSDPAFSQRLARRMRAQLKELALLSNEIVVFMHHLPFAQLLPGDRPARFRFAAAFLGARRFGEVLLQFPNVRRVYCGHSHWPAQARVGHIEAINVGSSYVHKRIERLQVP